MTRPILRIVLSFAFTIIQVIFVQPQFSAKSAELVAKEIGGEVAFVDPLAENWSDNLHEVANKFKAALK